MKNNSTDKDIITIDDKQLYKTIASVALPIALQSLVASSLSLVDNLMVGQLGETQLSAVGLATQIFFIFWMLMFGFTGGSNTFMSQFFGVKDMVSLRKTAGFAISVGIVAGILFFVPAFFVPRAIMRLFTDIPEVIDLGASYIHMGSPCFLFLGITVPLTATLRVTQQTSIPMKISFFVFGLNTFLNYVFIFGSFGAPQLGVSGAALATVIARGLELLLTIYVIFGRKNMVAGSLTDFFAFNKQLSYKITCNALPTTVNEVMWALGMSAFNAAYGRMGVTEFASVQASNTILNIFMLAIFSLGDAMLILVGQRIGRGEMEYAFLKAKKILGFSVKIGIISGLLLIVTSPFIINLFNFSPEGKKYAVIILVIYGVMMSLKLYVGMNIVGTFRAGGDTRFAMLLEVSSVWLIGVPLVFFAALYLHLPIYYVVLVAQVEEVVKCFIARKRFLSGKWLNNMISDL